MESLHDENQPPPLHRRHLPPSFNPSLPILPHSEGLRCLLDSPQNALFRCVPGCDGFIPISATHWFMIQWRRWHFCPAHPCAHALRPTRALFLHFHLRFEFGHARTRAKKQPPPHSLRSAPHDDARRGRPRNRCSSSPPSPSAPPDSMFAIHRRCKEEREGEDGEGRERTPN